jgi:TRAP-type mannitol/chloroaromatic compound transport system permease large subunit
MPNVPTTTIWRGVVPFIYADIVRMGVLIAFPSLSLFLPKWLGL